MTSIPPGWYPDPADPSVTRYWDGEGWRVETPPAPIAVAPQPPNPPAMPGVRPPVNWPEGWPFPPPGRVAPYGLALAAPMTRLAARLLDAIFLLLLNAIVNGWLAFQWWQEARVYFGEILARGAAGSTEFVEPPERFGLLSITILAVATLLWFAYEVPSTANTGVTLGKKIMGIRVIPMEGEAPLSMGRSLRRWNPMGITLISMFCCWPYSIFALIFPAIDGIFVAVDRYLHQALHDRTARTFVVTMRRPQDVGSPKGSDQG